MLNEKEILQRLLSRKKGYVMKFAYLGVMVSLWVEDVRLV